MESGQHATQWKVGNMQHNGKWATCNTMKNGQHAIQWKVGKMQHDETGAACNVMGHGDAVAGMASSLMFM
eukprot:scaffold108970_cov22-Tisochrysis_lutea.AAC.2